MKSMLLIFTLLLCCLLIQTTTARPQYKEIDFRLFEEENDDSGVIIDRIPERQPKHQPHKKHHKTEHKKKMMIETNRLERFRRYLSRL